jgi:hypothetical protein
MNAKEEVIEMRKGKPYFTAVLFCLVLFLDASYSFAHCDTMGGPVIETARAALDKGDVTPVLKWVKPEYESEIRALFQKTLAVRVKGSEAKELADMYFFETLVRLHRAGEGAAYTGLKPAEDIEPVIMLSDQALESGNADDLVEEVTKKVAEGIREHFEMASEAKKHVDESVEAGREYVEAYVIFTHYVEGIHNAAAGAEIRHEH